MLFSASLRLCGEKMVGIEIISEKMRYMPFALTLRLRSELKALVEGYGMWFDRLTTNGRYYINFVILSEYLAVHSPPFSGTQAS